ncbi:large conductance mechanosensitive channel protein MscL [Hamadaea tsunoensis]|uniref:large conductance mechanosensitive channel protein MscL n=1 Tax=Hamadaea tsunoensis TaxID=53368 RepID=UPI0003FF3D53|nr:large conductance mechanosensitive channel protein MscL [Hamadaea tsunoensis]
MLKGFRDFIMRGNVVDLAVGVVVGAAFTALVGAFTSSFLEPLINMVGAGNKAVQGAAIRLPGVDANGDPNALKFGVFVSAVITFLLTAAVIYFLVVLPMNKIAERRKRTGEPQTELPSEEIILLREIRDALLSGKPAPSPRQPAPSPVREEA